MCEHLHDPVGLRASLDSLGEHMHLEHFVCVYSYVGVAWPDAWFMVSCHHVYAAKAIAYLICCIAW